MCSGPGNAPRFAKRYAELKAVMVAGVAEFAAEVRSGAFPGPEHTYSIAVGAPARVIKQVTYPDS